MKTACIYHSVDLDGWMSAAIVEHWWILKTKSIYDIENNSIDFLRFNYGQPIPDLLEYDQVIMVDISFPAETMKDIRLRLKAKFIWIDHHISAINDNNKWIDVEDDDDLTFPFNGLRNTEFAACELTWKFLFPNEPMPEIVRLLGMYDSFRHKGTSEEQKVLEFQYGARQCISNYEEAYKNLTSILPRVEDIQRKGSYIYQYLCTEAKQSYKNGFPIQFAFKIPNVPLIKEGDQFHTYKFICINKERFNPVNFGIDYHADGYDGAACFHRTSNGKWAFSLYNDNGKVDCSLIAKQYGGGGHKGAAGMILTDEQFSKLIN